MLGVVFQRLSAARVDIDDLGAFNAILAVVGGTGLLGLGLQLVVVRQALTMRQVLRVAGAVTVIVRLVSWKKPIQMPPFSRQGIRR